MNQKFVESFSEKLLCHMASSLQVLVCSDLCDLHFCRMY